MITDELLRLVTPVIPISEWKQIAFEAFNLTVNEVDAIESAQTRADVIFSLLHQAVQRDQMPAKFLKQKIKDAHEDGIKIGQEGLENIEAGDGKLTIIIYSDSAITDTKYKICYHSLNPIIIISNSNLQYTNKIT